MILFLIQKIGGGEGVTKIIIPEGNHKCVYRIDNLSNSLIKNQHHSGTNDEKSEETKIYKIYP